MDNIKHEITLTFNGRELSEILIALDHRLNEDHAYVWREDAMSALKKVKRFTNLATKN